MTQDGLEQADYCAMKATYDHAVPRPTPRLPEQGPFPRVGDMRRSSNGQPPGVPGFRTDIQGLRAVAVLLVIIYHAGLRLEGGFVGVDVFFVVSGYVITAMLIRELERSGRVDFARFYLRRIRRLLPALGLMLAVVLLSSTLLAPVAGQRITARTGAAAALFNANNYLTRWGSKGGYFSPNADVNALLHTWSLSVEEQFYLVFPAALAVVWGLGRRIRRCGSRRSVATFLVVTSVGSFALSRMLLGGRFDPGGLGSEIAFYSAPTRAWEFSVGALIVFAPRFVARVHRRLAMAAAVAGLGLVGFSAVAFDRATEWPGNATLVPVAGTVALVLAGTGGEANPVTRLLSCRPLQYVGNVSYSWYLWHWPMIVFAAALWPNRAGVARIVGAALSLIPAVVSHRLVESPIRVHVRPRVMATVGLAAACVVGPVAGAGMLEVSASRVRAFGAEFALHADVSSGCDSGRPIGERNLDRCLWPAKGVSHGRAVLVGDSNAGHLTEGFVKSLTGKGFEVLVATQSGCPFVELPMIRDGTARNCSRFVEESLEALVAMRPKLVVMSSASDLLIESVGVQMYPRDTVDVPGELAQHPSAKASLWSEELHRIISVLESKSIGAAVVHPVPRLGSDKGGGNPRACAAIRLRSPNVCLHPRSRAEARAGRELAVDAERRAVAGTAAVALDPFDWLCPGAICKPTIGSEWMFRDAAHITVAASEGLADMFDELANRRG